MHGPTRRLAAVLAAAVVLVGSAVPAAGRADSSRDLQELRRASEALAARARSATLELYALDTRLAQGRRDARVARARVQAVGAERAHVRGRLRLARRSHAIAQRRLGERLVALYQEGDADALAVILGARSLDEVTTRLEGLDAVARQDQAIMRETATARVQLARLARTLAVREARLAAAAAASEARADAFERALDARRAYVARLHAERRLGDARIAAVERGAKRARARTARLTSKAVAGSTPPATSAAAATAPEAGATGPRELAVVATAYSLTGRTATGLPLGIGVVAVDPSVIPLGTRMTIPGYGEGIAADTGGAIQGAVIDVWFPSTAEARAWGRRAVTVTLH